MKRSGSKRDTRVVWVSFSYGFGPDLAYYGPLFAEFKRRLPGTAVPVTSEFPADRYPDLPLLPVLDFWDVPIRSRVGATEYKSSVPVPKPGSLLRLARIPADVYILIEFTAIAVIGMAVAKVKRRKTVLLIESDPSYRGSEQGKLKAAVKGWVARRANVVLVSNSIGKAFVERSLRVRPERLLVGAYLTSQPSTSAAGDDVKRADEAPVRFLFLNSVTHRKGIDNLLDAFGKLDPALRDRFKLDIVGSGEGVEDTTKLVEDLGLQGNVEFHGRVPYSAIDAFYQNTDVVVCPTLADYRSLAGFEAVNAGKPVLISKYDGAAPELSAATHSAIVFDPLDIDDLAAKLRGLIEDVAERESLIEHARDHIPAVFAVTTAGANVEKAVELALNGQQSGR